MDHFGIGSAVKAMLRVLSHSSRATGRTTSLIDSLRDGDRVLVPTTGERERLDRQCRERGLKVDIVVVDSRYEALRSLRPAVGRTIFEHTLVEKKYQEAVDMCTREIDEIQKRYSSGPEIKMYTYTNERWESL